MPSSVLIEVKLLQEQIKQKDDANIILPIMLTLKSKNEDNQSLQQRLPVDIIFVIDVSGSMDGEKIDLLKQSLISNLQILNDNDRVGIIEFETNAYILFDMVELSPNNRKMIVEKIKSVQSRGGTSINLGLQCAFEMLKKHKDRQSLKGIFFLSDGQDQTSDVQNIFNAYKDDLGTFQIKSFGYGEDHDPKIMKDISSLKNGDFVYVKDKSQIEQVFQQAIQKLQKIVFENIEMQINFANDFSGVQLLGECQIQQNSDRQALLLINSLELGQERNFIQELSIPKSQQKLFMPQKQKVIDVKLQANDPKINQFVRTEEKIEVEFVENQKQIKKIDLRVLKEYVRKSAANKMKEATHQDESSIKKEVDKVEEKLISVLIDLGQKKEEVEKVVQIETNVIKDKVKQEGIKQADIFELIENLNKPDTLNNFSRKSSISIDPIMEDSVQQFPISHRGPILNFLKSYPQLDVQMKNSLKLEIHQGYDSIKQKNEETLPLQLMVSLQTFSGCLKRRPIDVFIIVNTNSGMTQKLETIKQSLKQLIQSLDNQDRFGLMKYDMTATILIQLQQLESQQKRQNIAQVIDNLQSNPFGGTDVVNPLDMFKNMLDGMEQELNRPFGLFWILDSTTSGRKSSRKILLNNLGGRIDISIFTIGLGNDHDSLFLKQMAQTRFGHYYYVGNKELWRITDVFSISVRGLTSVQFFKTILHIRSCDQSVNFNLLGNDQTYQDLEINFGYLVSQFKNIDLILTIPPKKVKQFASNTSHKLLELSVSSQSLYNPDKLEDQCSFDINFQESNQLDQIDLSGSQSQQLEKYVEIQNKRYEYIAKLYKVPEDQKYVLKQEHMDQQKLFVGLGQPDHRSINSWSWCQDILYLQQKREKITERTIYQQLLEKYEEEPTIFEIGDQMKTSQLHVMSIETPRGQQKSDIQLNNFNYNILAITLDSKCKIYDQDWIPQINRLISSLDQIQQMIVIHYENSEKEDIQEFHKKIRQHLRFDPEVRLKKFVVDKIKTQCQQQATSQDEAAIKMLENIVKEGIVFIASI